MPFFSVIIPLYNKEKYIKNTLKNVLKQTFKNFEIIIINDGSTDNSLKEAQLVSDNRITIYTQKNSGVSDARNFGIKKARGEYIALLDADDIWNTNHLEEHYNSINQFFIFTLYSLFSIQRIIYFSLFSYCIINRF